MLKDEEDEACATDRIVEVDSGETVGLVYEWEDGTQQPFWFDGAKLDVVAIGICKLARFRREQEPRLRRLQFLMFASKLFP